MIAELLNEIKNFDCNPAVFNVSLQAPAYLDCFVVTVVFRNPAGSDGAHEFSVRNSNPMTALEITLGEMREKYGKCPNCNNYKNHAA